MKGVTRLIWQCNICKDVVISYSNIRHTMNYCDCGESAVDLEEHYQRNMGDVKELSRKTIKDGQWVKIM